MNGIRIGIIAQDINSGIGTQSWELARNLNVDKVLITDITQLHQEAGKTVTRHPKRFEDFERLVVSGIPNDYCMEWLTTDVDVVFVIETPLNYNLFNIARDKGVKTVLQYNAEFFDYAVNPDLPKPDLLMAPSRWWIERIKDMNVAPVTYLPVPVATDRFKPYLRTEAKEFIHIAGHKTYADRNGTDIVREIGGVTIHTQQEGAEKENYWELFNEGDVLVLPRGYGGLSLQLQEARAAGMPVVVGQHDPYARDNISVKSGQLGVIPTKMPVMNHRVDPAELKEKIEYLRNNHDYVKAESERSIKWAESHSWDRLKPEYLKVLKELCSPS